jgi:uncharacterized protein
MRARSGGDMKVMHQVWDKLLFLHWQVSVDELRARVPQQLQLDLHEGRAWIGVTPFTMRDVRPVLAPSIPVLSDTHELNVRTYVTVNGVPGVWFFSLDASNPLMVWGARTGLGLPYYRARMSLEQSGGTIVYSSRRIDKHGAETGANFEATWSMGEHLPPTTPGTIDHFVTERYCLYSVTGGGVKRVPIAHRQWPLRSAILHHLSSSMVAATGMTEPRDAPMMHALREPLDVDILSPERVQ